jgi:hypothetical protein
MQSVFPKLIILLTWALFDHVVTAQFPPERAPSTKGITFSPTAQPPAPTPAITKWNTRSDFQVWDFQNGFPYDKGL